MKIHRATLRVIQPEMMERLGQWIAINFEWLAELDLSPRKAASKFAHFKTRAGSLKLHVIYNSILISEIFLNSIICLCCDVLKHVYLVNP